MQSAQQGLAHSQRSVREEQPLLPVLGISESELASLVSSYIITNESSSLPEKKKKK